MTPGHAAAALLLTLATGSILTLTHIDPIDHTPTVVTVTDDPLPLRQLPTRASRSQRTPAPTPVQVPVREHRHAATGSLDWHALRMCESTNNYRAVNPSGKYRGAYQFDRPTWAEYGPPGDPAAASPAEQDRRAKALYADRGRSPWPRCGKRL